jgi:hypothetical protein
MATARKTAPSKPDDVADKPEVLDTGWGPDQDVTHDRVTVISRYADGEPAHRPGFRLVVNEGASEDELRAAWNHPDGELPPSDVIDYVRRPLV